MTHWDTVRLVIYFFHKILKGYDLTIYFFHNVLVWDSELLIEVGFNQFF